MGTINNTGAVEKTTTAKPIATNPENGTQSLLDKVAREQHAFASGKALGAAISAETASENKGKSAVGKSAVGIESDLIRGEVYKAEARMIADNPKLNVAELAA